MAVTKPGHSVLLIFSGTIGDKMRLPLGNVSIAQSDVSIQNPDGSQLVPATYVARNTASSVDTPVLLASGTYTSGSSIVELDISILNPDGCTFLLPVTATAGQWLTWRMMLSGSFPKRIDR